jgi:hypothetical protein
MTDAPTPLTARAVQTLATSTTLTNRKLTSQTVINYLTGPHDMEMIYLSNDPYGRTFKEPLDLRKCNLTQHPTAGLRFIVKDGWLILSSIDASTPSAQIDTWHSRLRGAWLISIDNTPISSITAAQSVFSQLSKDSASSCILTFTHPDFSPGISHNGLPIISQDDFTQLTHDQLNNWIDLIKAGPRVWKIWKYNIVELGDVRQYVTRVM